MKTLAVVLFALSLYLLPNPTHSTFNPIRLPATDVQSPVLDSDGNELRAGETYYITNELLPTLNFPGPQLAWLNSTTQCASNVVTSRCFTYGDPIRITPADPKATVVSLSTFLSFSFFVSTSGLCASSVYWFAQYDQPSTQFFLKSGEFDSNLSAQFQIQVHPDIPNTYRIVYYPLGDITRAYFVSQINDPSIRAVRWVLREKFLIVVKFRKTANCSDFACTVNQGVTVTL